jgi:hypothetical protein
MRSREVTVLLALLLASACATPPAQTETSRFSVGWVEGEDFIQLHIGTNRKEAFLVELPFFSGVGYEITYREGDVVKYLRSGSSANINESSFRIVSWLRQDVLWLRLPNEGVLPGKDILEVKVFIRSCPIKNLKGAADLDEFAGQFTEEEYIVTRTGSFRESAESLIKGAPRVAAPGIRARHSAERARRWGSATNSDPRPTDSTR